MTAVPVVSVEVAAQMDAMDRAAKRCEASEWREGFRTGADLRDLLMAARGVMHEAEWLDASVRVSTLGTGMDLALEAERDAMTLLAELERAGSSCSRKRRESAYHDLCRCRAEVRRLEAEVSELREYLEPLARRAGANISSVGQWPVEAA